MKAVMRNTLKRILIMALVLGTVCGSLGLQQVEADTHTHTFGSWTVTRQANCTTKGSKYRVCKTCGAKETKVIEAEGHLFSTHTLKAVCWQPGKKTSTCVRCGYIKEETLPKTAHTLTKVPATNGNCSSFGTVAYYKCSQCHKSFSDAAGKKELYNIYTSTTGHNYGKPVYFNSLQHKKVCQTNKSHVMYEKHTWDKGVVKNGKITYTCTVCKGTKIGNTPVAPSTGTNTYQGVGITRVCGDDRYITATSIAKTYMETTKQSKLNAIIVACGTDFPDALSGSFLAKTKKAPIIIWSEPKNAFVQDFIKTNVRSGGTVYILGGTSVVKDKIKSGMGSYNFVRLADANRFGTNLKILGQCSYYNDEILVCDGTSPGKGINALIASGTGQPILLVQKDGLTEQQKSWLRVNDGMFNRFTIIGNANSVDASVERDLKSYGTVKRITANNTDEMSAKVAKAYYSNPTGIAIATGADYPDGLCGGPLAIESKTPILLVTDSAYTQSAAYAKGLKSLKTITVFGGDKAVKKATAEKFVKSGKITWTEITKTK